ncbi:MAG: hypothetical protein JWP89_242 [Schlesneria sp.]|nr:hypothetical protein [Schlesneria sp.]
MPAHAQTDCAAFEGFCLIASGTLSSVAAKTKKVIDRGERAPILIFDSATGEQIEVDFRREVSDVVKSLPEAPSTAAVAENVEVSAAARGPGRPKLGVEAHEVTLLPKHWEWLRRQSGGASVALRKLVNEASRANEGKDRIRAAQEATYRFLSSIGGNLSGFEEVTRALFAGDQARFHELTESWPKDIRNYGRQMAAAAFPVEHGNIEAAAVSLP